MLRKTGPILAAASLALGALALSGCEKTGDNAAITDKDAAAPGAEAPAAPAAEGAAVPAAAGATPDAAATGAAAPAGGKLSAYVGKYPFDKVDGVIWADNPVVKAGIAKTVTDAAVRKAIATTSGPSAPIELIQGKVSAWGCEQHNCGPHQWMVMVDPASGATDVCYYDEAKSADSARWFLATGKEESRKGNCQVE